MKWDRCGRPFGRSRRRRGLRESSRKIRLSSRAIRTSCGLTRSFEVDLVGLRRVAGLGLRGCADPSGRRLTSEQVVQPLAHHHVLEQRHRPLLLQDDDGVAADGLQPVAELLGIAHGRRQRHHRDRFLQVDQHLLPHRATSAVGQVVHFVHHDVRETEQGAGTGVQHVPQDLGRHHDDRGLGVDRVVAGEQADLVAAVAADQVGVLLVAQSLDRGGVEALLPALQRQVDGELADQRLPGAGGRGHEHLVTVLEGGAGAELELVQLEVIERPELLHGGMLLVRAKHGVLLGRGAHPRPRFAPGADETRDALCWMVTSLRSLTGPNLCDATPKATLGQPGGGPGERRVGLVHEADVVLVDVRRARDDVQADVDLVLGGAGREP